MGKTVIQTRDTKIETERMCGREGELDRQTDRNLKQQKGERQSDRGQEEKRIQQFTRKGERNLLQQIRLFSERATLLC